MKLKHYTKNIQTIINKTLKENLEFSIKNTISNLPPDLKWLPHNMIAHPLMEIFYQLGLEEKSSYIHDITIPNNES